MTSSSLGLKNVWPEGESSPRGIPRTTLVTARIGRLRILDLDDPCAEACQEERGKRPGERQGEIEDREAFQCALRWRVVARHRVAGVYRSGAGAAKTFCAGP